MAPYKERILEVLAQWPRVAGVDQVYIFGSLVNDDGKAFKQQESDVDLISIVDEAYASDAKSRYEVCKNIRASVADLEVALLRAIKRYDSRVPIASINLVTHWETSRCIHKDGAKGLFYMRQFQPTLPLSAPLEQLANYIDDDFHAVNDGLIKLFQCSQTIRNQYLKTNVHDELFLDVNQGTDPIPKKIMRCAAACAAFERDPTRKPDNFESIDPLEGLEFVSSILNEARFKSDAEITELRKWVAVSRGARGTQSPMTPDQLLLLSEVIFDRARLVALPSKADKIGAAIKRGTN